MDLTQWKLKESASCNKTLTGDGISSFTGSSHVFAVLLCPPVSWIFTVQSDATEIHALSKTDLFYWDALNRTEEQIREGSILWKIKLRLRKGTYSQENLMQHQHSKSWKQYHAYLNYCKCCVLLICSNMFVERICSSDCSQFSLQVCNCIHRWQVCSKRS